MMRIKYRIVFACALLAVCIPAIADDWAAGIPVGTPFPSITAKDQHGTEWNNEKLLSGNGLLFSFNRSTNW